MRLFRALNDEGVTVVLVTHDEHVGGCARRIVRMRDGLIVGDEAAPHRLPESPSTETLSAAEAVGA
jgi:putative ABC transport system ATP-binding protein